MSVGQRWKQATDGLPLGQVKADDFRRGAYAYRGFWLVYVLLALALFLAGCEPQTLKGSIAGGECKIFERPPYAVLGARSYDQDWIDRQVEGGVGGCRWTRPAPRPAELDAPSASPKTPPPKATKKRGVIARIKAAVRREPEAPPAATPPVPTTVQDAPPVAPMPEVPKPRPRTRLELLLDPSGPPVVGAAPE